MAYAKPALTVLSPVETQSLVVRSARKTTFEITSTEYELHASEKPCWTPLFTGVVLVPGFPISDRGDEMGLEIPLDLLADIGGVRHAVVYEGGVVLKGFSHMFVPVQKVDDRIQWHAISNQDPETRLTYHDAISRCGSRALLNDINLEDIKQCRAFLGWCSTAVSRLGSNLADYENIDYSIAEETGRAFLWTGVSAGVSHIGIGTGTFKLGTNNGSCHFKRSGPYKKIISYAEKTPIVLYDTGGRKSAKHRCGVSDTGGQRAWLAPASAVMLHMVRHMHHLDPFEVDHQSFEADVTTSARAPARDILLRNENLRVSNDDEYSFKHVIADLWSKLEFLIDQNLAREHNMEGTPVRLGSDDLVRGYEFTAIVEGVSPFVLKVSKLGKSHGGWPQLVTDINALVLFANGFGVLILPGEEERAKICSKWHTLRTGLDYLATSTQMLTELYTRAGSRLDHEYLTSTGLRWHQENTLFGNCRNIHACQCDRLQRIVSKHSCGSVNIPGTLLESGAVIFGRSRFGELSLSSDARDTKIAGIYSQPNSTMVPNVAQEVSEDSTSSDSCVQSQSQTTAGSSIGSHSVCTTSATESTSSEVLNGSHALLHDSTLRKRSCSPVDSMRHSVKHTIDCPYGVEGITVNTAMTAAHIPHKRKKNSPIIQSDRYEKEAGIGAGTKAYKTLSNKVDELDPPSSERKTKLAKSTVLSHHNSQAAQRMVNSICSKESHSTTELIDCEPSQTLRRVGALNSKRSRDALERA